MKRVKPQQRTKPPPKFTKRGWADLRYMPRLVYKPLKVYGYAHQLVHCDSNEEPPNEPLIEIDSGTSGLVRMDTIFHEAMHLAGPYLQEDSVRRIATYIARVLWHAGYRPTKEETPGD